MGIFSKAISFTKYFSSLVIKLIASISIVAGLLFLWTQSIPAVHAGNWETAIWDASKTTDLWQWIDLFARLQKFDVTGWIEWSWWSLRDFLIMIWRDVLIPVIIFVAILFALIWFFRLMLSTSSEETKKATNFILRWIIGIMIMMSAAYIIDQVVGIETPWQWNILTLITGWEASWWEIAGQVYEKIFFPFLRVALFVVLWVLFIFALIAAFRYMFSSDEWTQKKNILWIVYAAVWIIVITLAKTMVEAIYGSYETVIQKGDNLWDIWTWILAEPNYEVLYSVINWILWLVTFIIVIILIYQWYLLLTNPNDEDTMSKLQKNFWYIFIGILIIWTAYLLVNFFIIQTA